MVKAWRSESSKTKWRKRKKQNSRFYQLAKWKLTRNCKWRERFGTACKKPYHFSDGLWTILIVPGSRTRADFPPAFRISRVGWNLPANARFFMNKTYFLLFWSRHDSLGLENPGNTDSTMNASILFNTALNTISSISVSSKLLPVNI